MKKLLLLGALLLSGCVDTWNAPYQAIKAEGVKSVQTFNDNAIEDGIQALCLVPYGAVVRNQSKIPNLGIIMPAACGAVTSAPVTLQMQAVPDSRR